MSAEITLLAVYLAIAYLSAQSASSARTRWEDVSIRRYQSLLLTREAVALAADHYHASVRSFLVLSLVVTGTLLVAIPFGLVGLFCIPVLGIIALAMACRTRQYLKELSQLFAFFDEAGVQQLPLRRMPSVIWNLIRAGRIASPKGLARGQDWTLPRTEVDLGV